VLFHLAIVLSVLLRYTDYDCPFGIFKLFLSTREFSILNILQHFTVKHVQNFTTLTKSDSCESMVGLNPIIFETAK
jgi:hypothetical protein